MSVVVEVLGQQVVLPDVDAIGTLADHYQSVSTQAADAHDELQSAGRDLNWQGLSSDLFRRTLGDLPGEMAKARNSYGVMATTLHTYADALGTWCGRYRSLAQTANDVSAELSQTQRALEQAKASGSDTSALQGRVNSLSSELETIKGGLGHLVDSDLNDLANACLQGIQGAESAGISNTFWGDIESAVGDVGGFINAVVLKPVEDLPGAVVNVVEHPGDLKAWSRLLGDVSSVVGVASLAIPGLGEVLLPVALGVDAAHLGVDTALVAEGQEDATSLIFDGVAVVGDGAGALSAGASAGDDAIKAAQDASDNAFQDAAVAERLGKDPSIVNAFDKTGIDSELAATGLQSSQSAWSLARKGLIDTVTFKPTLSASSWDDAFKDLNPFHDTSSLADAYSHFGAKSFSSDASVLLHRVTTVTGLTTFAIGTQAS